MILSIFYMYLLHLLLLLLFLTIILLLPLLLCFTNTTTIPTIPTTTTILYYHRCPGEERPGAHQPGRKEQIPANLLQGAQRPLDECIRVRQTIPCLFIMSHKENRRQSDS